MREGQFSRTALGAAGHRAAHQVLEGGAIFADPLAAPILGADAQGAIDKAREQPLRRELRLFVAARSRFAEEAANRALSRGVRQIVLLGAGLETFAYRLTPPQGARVFEIDHPATQAEKRRRLAAAGIVEPAHAVYVGCDFERQRFVDALIGAGFETRHSSFFFWLGVSPYLSQDAVAATLAAVAAIPGGAEIVFDYAIPPEAIARPAAREAHRQLAAKVAAAGEPLRAHFDPADLQRRLAGLGFDEVEDLDAGALAARYAPGQAPARQGGGARLVRASAPPTTASWPGRR